MHGKLLILCHFKITFEGWRDSSVGKDMYCFYKGPRFSSWHFYRSPQAAVSNPSSRRIQCLWLPWYLYFCVCMWTSPLRKMNSHLSLAFWNVGSFLLWKQVFLFSFFCFFFFNFLFLSFCSAGVWTQAPLAGQPTGTKLCHHLNSSQIFSLSTPAGVVPVSLSGGQSPITKE